MQIVQDNREQNPLEFIKVEGVEIVVEKLDVGDYGFKVDGKLVDIVVERKSVADLFSSFTNNYDAERNKILRAKEANIKYILAIEASCSKIREGHQYWANGAMREAGKSGIAQVKQLMTIQHKYGVEVWYCDGRADMAFRIQEYFLSKEKLMKQKVAA